MELAWETSQMNLAQVVKHLGKDHVPGITEYQWISNDKVRIRLKGVSTLFDDRHPIDQWYTIVCEGDKIKVWQE